MVLFFCIVSPCFPISRFTKWFIPFPLPINSSSSSTSIPSNFDYFPSESSFWPFPSPRYVMAKSAPFFLPFFFLITLIIIPSGNSAFSFPSIFGKSDDDQDQMEGNDDQDGQPENADLMCYRGIKYFVGQEEIDDNVKCELNALESVMPGMDKYCYKFTSHTGVTDFVKRGCSVVICSGLRNVCAKLEFEGVHGEMCCCSATSYCNSVPHGPWNKLPLAFYTFLAIGTLLFLRIPII